MVPEKINVRGSFKTFIDQLSADLGFNGFTLCGELEPRAVQKDHSLNHLVLLVDLPRVSTQMIALAPHESFVLPTCISIIEVYPGEISVSVVNPAEMLLSGWDGQLLYLAREVTSAVQRIVKRFAKDEKLSPDLVTSWE
jgi:hypothetical protein